MDIHESQNWNGLTHLTITLWNLLAYLNWLDGSDLELPAMQTLFHVLLNLQPYQISLCGKHYIHISLEYELVDANELCQGIQKVRVEPATRSAVATCIRLDLDLSPSFVSLSLYASSALSRCMELAYCALFLRLVQIHRHYYPVCTCTAIPLHPWCVHLSAQSVIKMLQAG